jgi:epoxyqueuosine reductase
MAMLEQRLKEQARALGFELAGIAPATDADSFGHFEKWLDLGHAGEMDYMTRLRPARRHPDSILADVRSVVMVGMNYRSQEPSTTPDALTGRVSCYAHGSDYHDVLRRRLRQLLEWVQLQVPESRGRIVVDTAPLLERDFARRAGLGWFGKNTMLLNKRLGSYFFLGGLLLNIALEPDAAHETSHCGTCRACLDACPTQAFPAPGQLDARRCISYLTIELRGSVPEDLRPQMGDWVFGCDICQEVCPWNRKAPLGREPELQQEGSLTALDLCEVLRLSPEEFRERFRGTALTRPGRGGLLRNAAIALGNRGDPSALPALQAAAHDPDPLVREAAQWAITRITQEASPP